MIIKDLTTFYVHFRLTVTKGWVFLVLQAEEFKMAISWYLVRISYGVHQCTVEVLRCSTVGLRSAAQRCMHGAHSCAVSPSRQTSASVASAGPCEPSPAHSFNVHQQLRYINNNEITINKITTAPFAIGLYQQNKAKVPHRRHVTPHGCKWIRPILTSFNAWFLGPKRDPFHHSSHACPTCRDTETTIWDICQNRLHLCYASDAA